MLRLSRRRLGNTDGCICFGVLWLSYIVVRGLQSGTEPQGCRNGACVSMRMFNDHAGRGRRGEDSGFWGGGWRVGGGPFDDVRILVCILYLMIRALCSAL